MAGELGQGVPAWSPPGSLPRPLTGAGALRLGSALASSVASPPGPWGPCLLEAAAQGGGGSGQGRAGRGVGGCQGQTPPVLLRRGPSHLYGPSCCLPKLRSRPWDAGSSWLWGTVLGLQRPRRGSYVPPRPPVVVTWASASHSPQSREATADLRHRVWVREAGSPCLVPGAFSASSSDPKHTPGWARAQEPSAPGLQEQFGCFS